MFLWPFTASPSRITNKTKNLTAFRDIIISLAARAARRSIHIGSYAYLSRSNSEDPADIERKLVLCTFAQLCVHFKLCTSTAVCVYTTRKPHLHKYEGLQLYSLSSIKATHIVALDKMHHLRPFAAPDQNNKLIEISRNYLVIFSENKNAPDFECP